MIPFILIRFVLLLVLDRNAFRRAAHFPPFKERERIAYWVYQMSTLAIFLCMFFLQIIEGNDLSLFLGIGTYVMGMILLILSVVHFTRPTESGIHDTGIYRISRNPMYIAYFVFFLGCVLLTESLLLLALVLIFQISAHWIVLSEERWCMDEFGEPYRRYMEKVRRYL